MIEIILIIVALAVGFALGWAICHARHQAQRGVIMAKTIQVCKALIVGAMESPEFHAAVMSQVHPGADPTSGFNFQTQNPPELPQHQGPVDMTMRTRQRVRRR